MIYAIRKANADDARAIVEVLDRAKFLEDKYRGEAGISLVESFVKNDLIWLVDLDRQVASVMVVQRNVGCLKIELVVTRPGAEFKRHGFARALTRKAKQIAADDKVDLVAYPENEKCKNLLITEHFKLDGESDDGLPRYIFQRKPE